MVKSNHLSLRKKRIVFESMGPGTFKCRMVHVEAMMATKQLDKMLKVPRHWELAIHPCKTIGVSKSSASSIFMVFYLSLRRQQQTQKYDTTTLGISILEFRGSALEYSPSS